VLFRSGQCVFISLDAVACICPTTHTGQFCEQRVYIPCNGSAVNTCHRDHGLCNINGTCDCNVGYTGLRCDIRNFCRSDTCLNGGVCKVYEYEPFVICSCPAGFYGQKCEIRVPTAAVTLPVFTQATPCDLNIRLKNSAGYNARFRVDYTLGGQSISRLSSSISSGLKTSLVIPNAAKDIKITLEKLGFSWSDIVVDRSVSIASSCSKCYVVWGTLFGARWDYDTC